MSKYKLACAYRDDGSEAQLFIEAGCESEARAIASSRGYLVSACQRVRPWGSLLSSSVRLTLLVSHLLALVWIGAQVARPVQVGSLPTEINVSRVQSVENIEDVRRVRSVIEIVDSLDPDYGPFVSSSPIEVVVKNPVRVAGSVDVDVKRYSDRNFVLPVEVRNVVDVEIWTRD